MLLAFLAGAGAYASGPVPEDQLLDAAARYGDLDGNGVIDAADLTLLAQRAGTVPSPTPSNGDLNEDGVIDREDVRLLLSRLGDVPESELYRILRERGMLSTQGGFGSGGSASAHHPIISSSNPGHSQSLSQSLPNHGTAMSDSWDHQQIQSSIPGTTPHTMTVSAQEWPPNHDGAASRLWDLLIPSHSTTVSAGWPPSHLSVVSQSFPHPEHENHISRTWPPAHEYTDSSKPGPWDHNEYNSDTYQPRHNTVRSRMWPNHRKSFSDGWGNHDANLSATWPPNHFAVITASWDQNDHTQSVSQTWPPNWHSQSYSDQAVIVVPVGPVVPVTQQFNDGGDGPYQQQ
jgi:hypothetical protein